MPEQAESYGKSAMVGENGELERRRFTHPKMGYLRKEAKKGLFVPSSKKMGSPGQVLDVPLGRKDAASCSHFELKYG